MKKIIEINGKQYRRISEGKVNTKFIKYRIYDKIADEINTLNKSLGKKNPYLLMGPGRWGTADPWLGIPVNWDSITNAKSIIEVGLDELNPDPSFGSHFFQNLTTLRIGYFTVNRKNHKRIVILIKILIN